MITEVYSGYYDDDEHCYYIDVWVDDIEEGFSVAKVYDSPLRIECIEGQDDFFSDPMVQEEIVLVIKSIFGLK